MIAVGIDGDRTKQIRIICVLRQAKLVRSNVEQARGNSPVVKK